MRRGASSVAFLLIPAVLIVGLTALFFVSGQTSNGVDASVDEEATDATALRTTTAPQRSLDAELMVDKEKCGLGECLTVTSDGRTVSELFIVTREPESGESVVLFDAGGPGYDPAGGLFIELLPSWIRDLPVVALREPWSWTTEPVDQSCWDDLERHVDAVRSQKASAPSVRCDPVELHGTPGRVIESARALEQSGAGHVIVVGHSFGAVRVAVDAQLTDWNPAWEVLLVDPAPHVGTVSASSLVEGRVDSALVALESVERGCRNACIDDILEIEASLPVALPDRSVEMTAADLHLGVVAAALRSTSSIEEIAKSLGKAAGDLSPEHLVPIAASADDASGRFGTRSHAEPVLANVVGLCLAYPGWSQVIESSWSGPAVTLAALYSICPQFEGAVSFDVGSAIPNSCAVLNPDDPAVAAGHVTGWRGIVQRVVEVPSPAHGGAFNSDRDLREECKSS